MRTRRLREIVAGPAPEPGRILYASLWFRSLNNARYAELLPRLDRVDACFLTASDSRIPRGVQYRAYRGAPGDWGQRLLLPRAAARYRGLLCTEVRQIASFPGPVVVDLDDPSWPERELELLRRPNVAATVVTADWMGQKMAAQGVEAPYHVIPQGVSLRSLPPDGAAARLRTPGEVVVGYVASLLFTAGDDEANHPLYGVDHLLELWDAIREQVPQARLWLLGKASERLQARLAGRDDVRLFGWLPRDDALVHVAAFDIALYPRRRDVGGQAVKVVEYLGAGVPTVSYDHEVVAPLRAGGAVLVDTPESFVDAVVRLAGDPAERARLSAEAKASGAALDWDVLARRYESEILDRYLPAP